MRQPSTAGAEAAGHLVSRVLDFIGEHRLTAGDRLPPERALAAKLGVGRNALREALATLDSLRVVETRAQSGVYVRGGAPGGSFETTVLLAATGAAPSPQEVRESMEVRAPLERQVMLLACERRSVADLAALEQVLSDTDAMLARGGNIADCDQAFHLGLTACAHNGVLARVLDAFYCLSLPRRRAYFADDKRARASAREHHRIFAAIKARDAQTGVSLIDRHLGHARTYWREALTKPKTT
ncbi:MAG: FadR/GntR family transcriptional regulator [Burkholderiales bacterium]